MTRATEQPLPQPCSALDAAFADLVRRSSEKAGADVDTSRIAAYAAAFLSHAVSDGNSCVSLETVARAFAGIADAALNGDRLRDALLRSGVAAEGDTALPLILDGGGRLYFQRHFAAEAKIASAVLELAKHPGRIADPAQLAAAFAELFPGAAADPEDCQALAAGIAATRRLTVIAGGPGTGKTTIVARILALLATADPAIRIALVAPTGKAAKRLSESIADQIEALPVQPEVKAALAVEATTLHRLLRYNPRSGTFARDARSRLPADLVVVDEASMVELTLFHALVDSLATDASLILLGDPDQLESVGSGYVFGDLCASRKPLAGRSKRFASDYRALGGASTIADPHANDYDDCVIELHRSYRFAPGSALDRIAIAIRNGDADEFFSAFPAGGDTALVAPPLNADGVVALAAERIDAYGAAQDLDQAFRALAQFRILCALREGPLGAGATNEAVSRRLGLSPRGANALCYDRRALLVTANNHAARLFNGDVGICWTESGRTTPRFPESDGRIREIAASKLPRCESAWAMTVHKSQGSEFEDVVLVLPDASSPILSRELLYTGATRAKSRLTIVADQSALLHALASSAMRTSGLRERIDDSTQSVRNNS